MPVPSDPLLRLKDRGAGVPGGFRFFQQETKTTIYGPHWWGLVQNVIGHRKSNRLPIQLDIEREIEQQLCKAIIGEAPNFVEALDGTDAVLAANFENSRRRWSFRDIAQFTLTWVDHLAHGNQFVPPAEADRRAAICAGCPQNIPVANCNNQCQGLKDRLRLLVGRRSTSRDGELQACQTCGCFNAVQIWFTLPILQRHTNDLDNAKLAEGCWKKRLQGELERSQRLPHKQRDVGSNPTPATNL